MGDRTWHRLLAAGAAGTLLIVVVILFLARGPSTPMPEIRSDPVSNRAATSACVPELLNRRRADAEWHAVP
ncbi:hypothetical protein [Nocardia bovistercoris]|uniref:Uncharacterized protein n=1 Tax=Nocardia bovistercoris TaxID=2785916 RepID=A0A931N6J5_9NOCA|nr:hypothetical protein [Nocardia bovistercoris]MBH0780817.1 hypothetical protein [Nocardia bovistercoris]